MLGVGEVVDVVAEVDFGFQKTENEKNEGGTLLLFKLLNLAIVLSLTNLLLSALKQRQLAHLIGEKRNEGNELSERLTIFRRLWLWWHYTKVYFGFFVYFLLPICLVVLAFTWYPN